MIIDIHTHIFPPSIVEKALHKLSLPIPEADQQKILGGNAQRIFHFFPKAVLRGTSISSS